MKLDFDIEIEGVEFNISFYVEYGDIEIADVVANDATQYEDSPMSPEDVKSWWFKESVEQAAKKFYAEQFEY